MDFIRRYRYVIYLVLGIVSAALLVPSIGNDISIISKYNDREALTLVYFDLIKLICILVAEVMFILMGSKRELNKYFIMTAAILYYASEAAYKVYYIVEYGNYYQFYSVAIYAVCLIFTLLALSDQRYLFSSLIILLIDAAFNLADTFAGSTLGMSTLFLTLILMSSIYFYSLSFKADSNYYS